MTRRGDAIVDRSRRSTARIDRTVLWVAALAIPFAAGPAWSAELDFHVRGSVRQFFVIAAPAQSSVALLDAKQTLIQRGVTDSLGVFVFRYGPPGDGYYAVVSSK